MLSLMLACVAVLLILPPLAIAISRFAVASSLVYGTSLIVSGVLLAAALSHLLGAEPSESKMLPVGVPWLGAHFRLDALAAHATVPTSAREVKGAWRYLMR